MARPDVQLSDLALGASLGSGGEGEVFALQDRPDEVYKQYFSSEIDEGSLAALIAFPDVISAEDKTILGEHTVWPHARVRDGDRVVGLLMPMIPARFIGRTVTGQKPRELQFLLFVRTRFWGDIQPLAATERITFLREFLAVVRILHRYKAVLGDVSQANVLWSEGPSPDVLLIDCDAIRLPGHGTVSKPKETPDWIDSTLDGADPDIASDRYKIAVLVMRVLTADAYGEPPECSTPFMQGVPVPVVDALRELLRRTGGSRSSRPAVDEWDLALRGLPGTPVTPEVVRQPVPSLDLASTSRPSRPWINLKR